MIYEEGSGKWLECEVCVGKGVSRANKAPADPAVPWSWNEVTDEVFSEADGHKWACTDCVEAGFAGADALGVYE